MISAILKKTKILQLLLKLITQRLKQEHKQFIIALIVILD